MRPAEPYPPRFYFALPRLVARLRGRNFARIENNWIEANIAGAAVMLVSYLAIAHGLLRGAPCSKQLLLLLPIIIVTWLFWLLVLYINAQLIKLLRAAGVVSSLSNARVQSVLIGAVTTVLSCSLINTSLRVVSAMWIAGVSLNLLAAALLGRDQRDAG